MSKKVLVTLFCACVLFLSNLAPADAAPGRGSSRRGLQTKNMLATPCTASVFPFNIGNPEVDPIATVTISNQITGAALAQVTIHASAGFPPASNIAITPSFSNCAGSIGSCTGYPLTSCPLNFSCSSCPVQPSGTVTVAITAMDGETTYTQAFPYTFCCPVLGCTRTAGYWACHTDNWPVDSNTLFCTAITSVVPAAVCSDATLTLLDVLQSESQTPWYFLAKEWVAAYLNISVAYGSVNEALYGSCLECPSCSNQCTTNAFDAAASYLAEQIALKDTSIIDPAIDAEMFCLEEYLNDFNLGFIGGICPNFCRDAGCATPTCEQCAELQCDCAELGCICEQPTCETLGCITTCQQVAGLGCSCDALGCSFPTPTCADINCTCETLGCVCPPPNCSNCPVSCNTCMEACQLCICKDDCSSSSSSSSSCSR